jgi:hypothetical protein
LITTLSSERFFFAFLAFVELLKEMIGEEIYFKWIPLTGADALHRPNPHLIVAI